MAGMYEKEYKWAVQHKKLPEAKNLLTLADMYYMFPEQATLGLIQESAVEIRELMKYPAKEAVK